MQSKALGLMAFVFSAPLSAAVATASDPAQAGFCGTQPGESVRTVWHFLYFASQADADRAIRALPAAQYRHQVMAPLAESERWSLYLEHTPVPDAPRLDSARRELEALSEAFGGEYGWHGCELERAS